MYRHLAGLAFADLYQKCREAFLVNSDLTLRTQLTEFKDHKLIRTKKVSTKVKFWSLFLLNESESEDNKWVLSTFKNRFIQKGGKYQIKISFHVRVRQV